jgi:hypothetical protein
MPGDTIKYSWEEFIDWFSKAKEVQDESFMKVKSIVEMDKKVTAKKAKND